jgi:Rps23 Pro-64 3,4-dihydroxylase Tpa1-like proline 4-hydroxylase
MTYQEPIKMPDGTKQNNQIDLDGIYKDRKISNILNTLDKIYGYSDLVKKLNDMSWFYKVWSYTNLDQSFVAYYEDTDYYKAHRDIAVISIMYWLWEEPKSFTGGNIHLTDYDIEIPLERNQLMIMPSSLNHAVDPIKMIKQTDKLSGMGRYCVVRFLKLK